MKRPRSHDSKFMDPEFKCMCLPLSQLGRISNAWGLLRNIIIWASPELLNHSFYSNKMPVCDSSGHWSLRNTAVDHRSLWRVLTRDKRVCVLLSREMGSSLPPPGWAQHNPAPHRKREPLLLKTFIIEYMFMRQFPNLIRWNQFDF